MFQMKKYIIMYQQECGANCTYAGERYRPKSVKNVRLQTRRHFQYVSVRVDVRTRWTIITTSTEEKEMVTVIGDLLTFTVHRFREL